MVKPDQEGRFVLTGLIPRNTYRLTVQPIGKTTIEKQRSMYSVSFDVHDNQLIELGEIRVNPPQN